MWQLLIPRIMKTKESRILFLCLILCLLDTTTKAQNASSEATMETRSSIPGAGYDCLGVWKMISSALHEVKNGVFECKIELPPEACGGAIPPSIYGPSIIFRNFTANYLVLQLDINELIPESKLAGSLVTYELVVPKWVDNWGRPSPSQTGIICHYHIEVRLNNLF